MALRSDAAGDRAYLTATLPDPTSTGLTVCGWWRIRVDLDDFSCYYRTSTGAGGGTIHTVDTNSGGLNINVFTTAGSITDAYANSVDEWVFIGVVDAGAGTTVLYWLPEGGSISSTSGSINSGTPGQICVLGRGSSDSTEWCNGAAAYVRVFADALTQAELEAEAASTSAVLTAWADWPLDSDLADDSGNGRDLTAVSGTPAYESGPSLSSNASPNAGHASATATALTPAAAISPAAGLASAAAAAQAPSIALDVTAGHATAAAAAQAPDVVVGPAAGLAAASATALTPSVTIDATPTAGHATAAAAGLAPTPTVGPAAGLASATGTALTPTVIISPDAGHASVTAAALTATAGVPTDADVDAGPATATATALAPTVTVVSVPQGGQWQDLAAILDDARLTARALAVQRPTACPNDGEPLLTGPGGVLFCKSDGWRA